MTSKCAAADLLQRWWHEAAAQRRQMILPDGGETIMFLPCLRVRGVAFCRRGFLVWARLPAGPSSAHRCSVMRPVSLMVVVSEQKTSNPLHPCTGCSRDGVVQSQQPVKDEQCCDMRAVQGGAQLPRKVNELCPNFNMRLHKELQALADISNSRYSFSQETCFAFKLCPLLANQSSVGHLVSLGGW